MSSRSGNPSRECVRPRSFRGRHSEIDGRSGCSLHSRSEKPASRAPRGQTDSLATTLSHAGRCLVATEHVAVPMCRLSRDPNLYKPESEWIMATIISLGIRFNFRSHCRRSKAEVSSTGRSV